MTIKEAVLKYFTANSTYKYVDIPNDLVNYYNNNVLSTLSFIPVQDPEVVKLMVQLRASFSKPKLKLMTRLG